MRAAELIDVDADEITGQGAERTDSVGRSWLLSLLPASRHEVGSTHDETGSGSDFAFRRREVDWDPERELADFADDE